MEADTRVRTGTRSSCDPGVEPSVGFSDSTLNVFVPQKLRRLIRNAACHSGGVVGGREGPSHSPPDSPPNWGEHLLIRRRMNVCDLDWCSGIV